MKGYAPHAFFVDPARRSSALFHTFVGFWAIEFFYGLVRDAVDFVAFSLFPDKADEYFELVSAPAMLYDLFAFLSLIVVMAVVIRLTHQRGLATLIGDARLARQDVVRALLAAVTMHLVLEFVLPVGAEGARIVSLSHWLLYLPWALLALLVQTSAEEMFYRGYLQQQLAARFPNPLVWMVVPNLAFAWVHWNNADTYAQQVQYVVWAFVFGMLASDLTARSGTLGAAIGYHFANNIFAFLVFGDEGGPDSGLALLLFPVPEGAVDVVAGVEPVLTLGFGMDLLILVLVWLAVRVAIRR